MFSKDEGWNSTTRGPVRRTKSIMEKCCRLCLKNSDILVDVFQSEENLPDKILRISPHLEPHVEDGLPHYVCQHCIQKVNICYEFLLQCENSYAQLKQQQKVNDSNIGKIGEEAEVFEFFSEKLENQNETLWNCSRNSSVSDKNEEDSNGGTLYTEEDSTASENEEEVDEVIWVKEKKRRKRRQSKLKESEEVFCSCKICGTVFATISKLNSHMLISHDIEGNFRCKDCGENLRSSAEYKAHSHAHNLCEICGKTYSSKSVLHSHLRIHTGVKPYECTICGHKFTEKKNLKTHFRVHSGERHLCCEICGRKFNNTAVLRRHRLIHSEEKPWECNVCGMKFRLPESLKFHSVIHTDLKPFECEICGRAFQRSRFLKRHIRTHTGERPYPCKVCGKNFSSSYNLRIHHTIHTGEMPYECEVCGQKFRVAVSLRNHAIKHEDNGS